MALPFTARRACRPFGIRMTMRVARYGLALLCAVLAVACGKDSPDAPAPGSPTAPSGTPAAADGSTLKATLPAPLSPRDGVRVETLRPALTFSNSTGRFTQATFAYRVEVYEGTTLAVTPRAAAGRRRAVHGRTRHRPEVRHHLPVARPRRAGRGLHRLFGLRRVRDAAAAAERRRRRGGRAPALDWVPGSLRDHPGRPRRRALEPRIQAARARAVSTSCGGRSASSTSATRPSTRRAAIPTGA